MSGKMFNKKDFKMSFKNTNLKRELLIRELDILTQPISVVEYDFRKCLGYWDQ